MKKSQISFEFILIFAIVLFVFIGIWQFFPVWLKEKDYSESVAQKILNDIKLKTMIASLSESDFESKVNIPSKINGKKIKIGIYKTPDNLLRINNTDDGLIISSVYLPKIDEVIENDPDGNQIIIRKDSDSLIIIRD